MAFTRRIFTKEFRLNAAKLVVDEHRPAVDVARELDINPKSLYSWVRQYRSGLLQASLDGEDSVSAEQQIFVKFTHRVYRPRPYRNSALGYTTQKLLTETARSI